VENVLGSVRLKSALTECIQLSRADIKWTADFRFSWVHHVERSAICYAQYRTHSSRSNINEIETYKHRELFAIPTQFTSDQTFDLLTYSNMTSHLKSNARTSVNAARRQRFFSLQILDQHVSTTILLHWIVNLVNLFQCTEISTKYSSKHCWHDDDIADSTKWHHKHRCWQQ